MDKFVDMLVPFAVLAVAVVLVLGLINMLRGGTRPLPAPDAPARAPAVRRDHRDHGRDLVARGIMVERHFRAGTDADSAIKLQNHLDCD